jgi:hypothetical protein
MPREPPVTSATLPASLLVKFVFMYLRNDLPLRFESAQYHVPCAAMLFRHNGLGQWNFDICDTFWLLVKR